MSGNGVSILNLHLVERMLPENGRQVHGAPAKGLPLHTNGNLGADMLFVGAGAQFPVHTHPGDHLLYCLSGRGTITVDQVTYEIFPGDIYMVDGLVPHAVGAITDHVLVAIGSPHKPVDSPERMKFVDWDGRQVENPLLTTATG
jgi:quercetin dioxygenase-like cupin family protein